MTNGTIHHTHQYGKFPYMYITQQEWIWKQVYQVGFLYLRASIMNTGRLKLITKPFDTGWNLA